MFRRWAIGLALLAAGAPASAGSDASREPRYPPPPRARDADGLGVGIQRTMTLLASSTPERRNKVRILFYGQSITEQMHWRSVVEDLRRRFPSADIEAENRAIGGFASALLIRPAEHDVFAYYPDLVIFHVYGGHREYEAILRGIRSRTTAEVLLMNDHLTAWPAKPADRDASPHLRWDFRMNSEIVPGLSKKYGCGLLDVRSAWADYLTANKLQPRDLLADEIHLNAQGKYLQAELVKGYLVYRPGLPKDGWRDLTKTHEIGGDLAWTGDRLTLAFEGNRVDAIAGRPAGPGGRARVLIDGKKPSEFDGAYAIDRPAPGPWAPLALTRVDHDRPLVVEDWTLTVTSFGGSPARWRFEVAGSKTGADGVGDSGSTFLSNSGRVRIEPESWFPQGPVEPGYRISWSVRPMFTDVYAPPEVVDPTRESPTTLVQGIPNGPHTLELVVDSGERPALRSIRAYSPPFSSTTPPAVWIGAASASMGLAVAALLIVRRVRSGRRAAESPPA